MSVHEESDFDIDCTSYVHSVHLPCRKCNSCLQAGSAEGDSVWSPLSEICAMNTTQYACLLEERCLQFHIDDITNSSPVTNRKLFAVSNSFLVTIPSNSKSRLVGRKFRSCPYLITSDGRPTFCSLQSTARDRATDQRTWPNRFFCGHRLIRVGWDLGAYYCLEVCWCFLALFKYYCQLWMALQSCLSRNATA